METVNDIMSKAQGAVEQANRNREEAEASLQELVTLHTELGLKIADLKQALGMIFVVHAPQPSPEPDDVSVEEVAAYVAAKQPSKQPNPRKGVTLTVDDDDDDEDDCADTSGESTYRCMFKRCGQEFRTQRGLSKHQSAMRHK